MIKVRSEPAEVGSKRISNTKAFLKMQLALDCPFLIDSAMDFIHLDWAKATVTIGIQVVVAVVAIIRLSMERHDLVPMVLGQSGQLICDPFKHLIHPFIPFQLINRTVASFTVDFIGTKELSLVQLVYSYAEDLCLCFAPQQYQ